MLIMWKLSIKINFLSTHNSCQQVKTNNHEKFFMQQYLYSVTIPYPKPTQHNNNIKSLSTTTD